MSIESVRHLIEQEIAFEKDSRIRYQGIVYAVCNWIDARLGLTPGMGTQANLDEVMQALAAVVAATSDRDTLRAEVEVERLTKQRDFPGGFTLASLYHLFGGEIEAWEAYFEGKMDADVQIWFERAVNPVARQVAIMMRAHDRAAKKQEGA